MSIFFAAGPASGIDAKKAYPQKRQPKNISHTSHRKNGTARQDGRKGAGMQGTTDTSQSGRPSFILYTDGSCLKNPGGSGGYGIVLIDTLTGEFQEKSEGFFSTTNNRMEVMAAIEGLSMVPSGSEVELVSDSQYLVKTLDGYFSRNKNHDLWAALDRAMAGKNVRTKWVRGHNGTKYNERCDELAMAAAYAPSSADTGYHGSVPSSSQAPVPAPARDSQGKAGSMGSTLPDTIPAPGGAEIYGGEKRTVKPGCMAAIQSLNHQGNLRFKDFASLKTGGIDGWSRLKDPRELVDEGTAAALEAAFPSPADAVACVRWYGRGLKFPLCIRKVLVDAEIRENAAKTKYAARR